jgi:hypothetical protein
MQLYRVLRVGNDDVMELMRKQGMSEEGVGNHQTWRLGVRILK